MHTSVIFLIGPTAVGKSAVAVALAKKINAEIISCDSMQVYKGMCTITSQPSAALRKAIPHHLLGTVPPDTAYDVSLYRRQAVRALEDIVSRGKTALFVGGTGLYMSIVVDGIFDAKARSQAARNRLYKQAEVRGRQYLYDRLKAVDAKAAAKIHRNDLKRIVRALEVFECTGKPISQLQTRRQGLGGQYDVKLFCLTMDRQVLNQRIDRRVEAMFKRGLIGEVKKLMRKRHLYTASYAIGIRELKGYIEGAYDLAEAVRLIKRNTRLYAKRQLTWFRKDKRIRWIEVTPAETPQHIVRRILTQMKG
jgi:tRNA dimethylallyltransferase